MARSKAENFVGEERVIRIEVGRAPRNDFRLRRFLCRGIDRRVVEGSRRAQLGIVRARIKRGTRRIAIQIYDVA